MQNPMFLLYNSNVTFSSYIFLYLYSFLNLKKKLQTYNYIFPYDMYKTII